MAVSYSFCKQSNKVHLPSSPYITQKIHQIWFSCKGRKQRNKKTTGAAENQRNAGLCIAESRKPGFLDKNSSVHTPSWHTILYFFVIYYTTTILFSNKFLFVDFNKTRSQVCWFNRQRSGLHWKTTKIFRELQNVSPFSRLKI